MKKVTIIIRITLTLLILYGVYMETGVWTTLSLFLIFVGMEAHAYLMNKLKASLSIKNIINGLLKK